MNNEVVQHALSAHSFHVPDEQELIEAWHEYCAPQVSTRKLLTVRGVRGVVVERPDVKHRILSVDLCEVIRRTHESCAVALGYDASYISQTVWDYSGYGLSRQESDGLARTVINRRLVAPVAEIDTIRGILRHAHQHMLIIANTSTALGTEVATIQFLSEHLPGCFDGILFPRNFEGDSQLTKGHALDYLIQTLGVRLDEVQVAHIDDAPYHNEAVLKVFREQGVGKVRATMPLFRPGRNAIRREPIVVPPGVATVKKVEDAFRLSTKFLAGRQPAPVTE